MSQKEGRLTADMKRYKEIAQKFEEKQAGYEQKIRELRQENRELDKKVGELIVMKIELERSNNES